MMKIACALMTSISMSIYSDTETVFYHAALLTKMDRRHRMTKCKENTKHYGNKVLTNQYTAHLILIGRHKLMILKCLFACVN